MVPSPIPGNTKTLFAWLIRRGEPFTVTGSNGLPVATKALPSLQRKISSGNASEIDVGFDIGKMTGASLFASIAATTDSVNAPPCPEAPTNTLLPQAATTSCKFFIAPSSSASSAAISGDQANSCLYVSSPLRSDTSTPRLSITRIALANSEPDRPDRCNWTRNCRAIPSPAAPAP